jgi:hypothetical protein
MTLDNNIHFILMDSASLREGLDFEEEFGQDSSGSDESGSDDESKTWLEGSNDVDDEIM